MIEGTGVSPNVLGPKATPSHHISALDPEQLRGVPSSHPHEMCFDPSCGFLLIPFIVSRRLRRDRLLSTHLNETSKPVNTEKSGKELSAPFASGGGGLLFENQVQTVFVVLMLTGGVVPCLPSWPIVKIKLQGRYAGYHTDDFIVFVEQPGSGNSAKLLAQIKHNVAISEGDSTFSEVIDAAWHDFKNADVFDPSTDALALICGPLSAHDIENARVLLEWARTSETAKEFLDKVELTKFSSEAKRNKLQAFKTQLKKANKGVDLTDDELWEFLKSFHILSYDLDVKSGVTLSLLMSHIRPKGLARRLPVSFGGSLVLLQEFDGDSHQPPTKYR